MTIQADLQHAHATSTIIMDGIDSAIVALHDTIGAGYPSKASGATGSTVTHELVKDPTDPTDRGSYIQLTRPEMIMEGVVMERPDPGAEDLAALAHHAAAARSALTAAARIIERYQRPTPRNHRTDSEAPDNWCSSCWRNAQHHTPVTLKPKSDVPYYAGLCRWCGQFETAHKKLPPLEILKAHHQGKRITMDMIDSAKPVRPTKKPKKKNRKGRATPERYS